jgi:hypothetical protein
MFLTMTPLRMPTWRSSKTLDSSTPNTSVAKSIGTSPLPISGQQMQGRQRGLELLDRGGAVSPFSQIPQEQVDAAFSLPRP